MTDLELPRAHRPRHLHRFVLALLATLPLVACGGRWERQHYPTPWVAPGRQVTPYFKPGSDPGLGRMEWRDSVQGRTYNPYQLSDAIRQFMERQRMFASWPGTRLVDASEKTPL